MDKIHLTPLATFRAITLLIVGIGIGIFGSHCTAQVPTSMVNGLEPERISPSPDATPVNVRKDLPLPKDENGTRDVFLYLDGNKYGRVAHLKIPETYVSIIGRPVDRHARRMTFSMIWPDLNGAAHPDSMAAAKKNNYILSDEQIEVTVGPNDISSLLYDASRVLGEMHKARTIATWITYEDIPPLPDFNQGIRRSNYGQPHGQISIDNAITDYYIEWLLWQQPQKFMKCQPYYGRGPCDVQMYVNDDKTELGFSIHFYAKLLPHIKSVIIDVQSKINSFIVKTYPPYTP